MPAAVGTITVTDMNKTWFDGKYLNIFGTLTITVGPATYVTGGIVCSLAHPLVKAQRPPLVVWINSQNGLVYAFVPGTTVANGLLKIFTAVGTELGNGNAIPAANSSDIISFEAEFLGQN